MVHVSNLYITLWFSYSTFAEPVTCAGEEFYDVLRVFKADGKALQEECGQTGGRLLAILSPSRISRQLCKVTRCYSNANIFLLSLRQRHIPLSFLSSTTDEFQGSEEMLHSKLSNPTGRIPHMQPSYQSQQISFTNHNQPWPWVLSQGYG